MLVVKIELWPQGRENEAHQIGELKIANDGSGTQERGNYDVALAHAGDFWGKPGDYKTGRVEAHLRRLSPYHLLLAALSSALSTAPPSRPSSSAPNTTPCKACGKPMIWGRTEGGRAIPLDPEPVRAVPKLPGEGSIGLNLLVDGGRVVVCRLAEPTDREVLLGRASHFSTCPEAGRFRGRSNG